MNTSRLDMNFIILRSLGKIVLKITMNSRFHVTDPLCYPGRGGGREIGSVNEKT